jgi:hypothetical protein
MVRSLEKIVQHLDSNGSNNLDQNLVAISIDPLLPTTNYAI